MQQHSTAEGGVSQLRLWIGLMGGGVAWFVHFLLVYVISEWRCVGPLPDLQFLGMTGTAWLLLGVSVILFAAACAATVISYRTDGARRATDEPDDLAGPAPFLARTGVYLSGLFAFVIVVEAIPIFFFRTYC